MATSAKQIAANRRNAKKSTGPRTSQGKAVASRNAITHGLHACDIILKSPHLTEDRSQYEHLLDSLIDELKPKGILQEHLVLKIANSLWRYRRVINAETARINQVPHPEALRRVGSSVVCGSPDSSARSARNPFMGPVLRDAPRPPTHPRLPAPESPPKSPTPTNSQIKTQKYTKRTHFR